MPVRALKVCSKHRVTKFFYRRGIRGQSAALLYLQGQRTAHTRGYALGYFEARFLCSVGNIRQFLVLQYACILSDMNTNDWFGYNLFTSLSSDSGLCYIGSYFWRFMSVFCVISLVSISKVWAEALLLG